MLSSSSILLRYLTSAAEVVAGSQSFLERTLAAAKVFEQARIAQAEEDREEHLADREDRDARSSTGHLATAEPKPLNVLRYRDDKAAQRRALERHYKSPAYRELHRRYISHTGLGGFGGEPGFEFAPRMYVDPDRPHMKSMFNSDPVASNVRYARFGHFIKELHMLDIDKLYRFARMVPSPPKLFLVMVQNRVPMPDKTCGALLRQQGRRMRDMETGLRRSEILQESKALFERMLLQNLPPCEVGVMAHAELIKCCGIAKDWSLGWDVVHERAVSEMTRDPTNFMLNSDYFEAVIELCASCYKVKEGIEVFEQLLAINLRPTQRALDIVMDLMSQSVSIKIDDQFDSESLADGQFTTASRTSVNGPTMDLMDDVSSNGKRFGIDTMEAVMLGSTASFAADAAVVLPRDVMEAVMQKADELWALYEFYDYVPTAASVKGYVKVLSALGQHDRVLVALDYAATRKPDLTNADVKKNSINDNGLVLDEECYLWALHGLRHMPSSAPLADQVVQEMAGKGFTISPSHHQAVLMGMALRKDAVGTLQYVQSHILPQITSYAHGVGSDVSLEMLLYPMLAMALGEESTRAAERAMEAVGIARKMIEAANAIMAYTEKRHSSIEIKDAFYEAYAKLCSWAGEAVIDAHSQIKKALSEGCHVSTRMLNHVLLANANSPTTGNMLITQEITQMLLVIPHMHATAETFVALEHCKTAHGGITALTEEMWDQLLARAMSMGQAQLPAEERVQPTAASSSSPADGTEATTNDEGAAAELSDGDAARLLDSIPHDAALSVPYIPVHAFRRMAVSVNIRAYDVALKRHGQFSRIKRDQQKVAFGSMHGRTKAFAHKDSTATWA